MYFDDNFLKSLPEDIPSAILAICEKHSWTIHPFDWFVSR